MTGWWLNQPIWKICSSKWVHLPQWVKKKLKPPASNNHVLLNDDFPIEIGDIPASGLSGYQPGYLYLHQPPGWLREANVPFFIPPSGDRGTVIAPRKEPRRVRRMLRSTWCQRHCLETRFEKPTAGKLGKSRFFEEDFPQKLHGTDPWDMGPVFILIYLYWFTYQIFYH